MRTKFFLIILLIGGTISCSKDDGVALNQSSTVNEFIWSAMNLFYFWQAEVPELSDEKNSSKSDLNAFLNSYDSPENLFADLLFVDDRFSWIVDDYEALEASFQGISKSFGYELRLLRVSSDSDDLLAYVKYVVPGGPADSQGLSRGDLFTRVDNIKITVDNFASLLFDKESYTIRLSTITDNEISETDTEITLVAEQLTENPILLSKIIDAGDIKVGYLVYNQFINNNAYHEQLNEIIGEFKNARISDMVLDLRYNGGGSLTTTRILSSMLYAKAGSDDILGSIIYNEKLSEFSADLTFLTKLPIFNSDGEETSSVNMNRLDLNRIFILTTGSTASASEFVIAGLLPYLDVTVIGTTTVGKNVGSVTLYDSEDYLRSGTINPNHKYAIQPIISQLANSEGFSDYINGLDPNIVIEESNYLEDLKELGDPEEPLLSEALAIITGLARTERRPDQGMIGLDKELVLNNKSDVILIDDQYIPKSLRNYIFEAQ